MAMLLGGIDEAGYGPMLGPMTVGLAVLEIAGEPAGVPDLWSLLAAGICREPGRGGSDDPRGRVAIADSKELKRPNGSATVHPLVHLERGVLAMARLLAGDDDGVVEDENDLRMLLNAPRMTDPLRLPTAMDAARVGIGASVAGRAMASAGVRVRAMRLREFEPTEFNAIVRGTGSKAGVSEAGVLHHLRAVVAMLREMPEGTRAGVACDRLGGRTMYAELLSGVVPGARVEVLQEDEGRSRYVVHVPPGDGGADGARSGVGDRRLGVAFMTEGETHHLPVALASMVAKYARELAMARFNRDWSRRALAAGLGELKPTAGYVADARRWLVDAGPMLSPEDRRAIVRLA